MSIYVYGSVGEVLIHGCSLKFPGNLKIKNKNGVLTEQLNQNVWRWGESVVIYFTIYMFKLFIMEHPYCIQVVENNITNPQNNVAITCFYQLIAKLVSFVPSSTPPLLLPSVGLFGHESQMPYNFHLYIVF